MNRALRRSGLVGLALGAAAGLGLLAFVLYRTRSRRRAARCLSRPEADGPGEGLPERPDLEEVLAEDREAAAQAQALAAVEAAVQGLSPEQQLELRNQLDQVLTCVSSLRSEVAELRDGLQDIAVQIIQDVKRGVEDSQRVRRRRHLLPRERTDSTSSSSIYFTASQGVASAFDETSEGGYSTAYAESDYTDRDTDKEEGEPEQDSDEDQSCATVVTLKLEEEEEEEEDLKEQKEACPSGELALLLAQSDVLHTGDASLKAEGYRLLLDNKEEYGDRKEFAWRLARAYRDMYQSTTDKQDKIVFGQLGREEAEEALKKSGLGVECHKWFAVLTGLTTLHEGLHGKLKSTQIFKEHLDRALALTDNDHICFYLLGRWSYTVATLDWLEKRAAAALHPNPPTASLHDALENFLKAEELRPGFCRNVRLYIAKCYKELNNISEATHWTQQALRTPPSCEDDAETVELENQLQHLTDPKI